MAKQEPLPKDVDPVLTCADLNAKLMEIDAVCRPIQNTPKPKPKEEKKPEAKAEDKATDKAKNKPAENATTPNEVNGDVPMSESTEKGVPANDTTSKVENMEVDQDSAAAPVSEKA